MQLRYGMNPHQRPATAVPIEPERSPIRVIHGEPSYLNVLDALGAWQLVIEASRVLGVTAAASFKHTSPAGAAVAGSVDEVMAQTYRVDRPYGRLTSAYVRARDTDPRSSYGDMVAVSEPVDEELAALLRRLVCDGIVAPGYASGTVANLAEKKNGRFVIIEAGPAPTSAQDVRDVYGLRLSQPRDDIAMTRDGIVAALDASVPRSAVDDLLLGMTVVRHAQSNAVAYVRDGMTIGIGVGQQSRIDCTRLAGAKADVWWLRRHSTVASHALDAGNIQERVSKQVKYAEDERSGMDLTVRRDWLDRLDGVSFASDGAIPFRDNIDEAARHGVRYVAEPGGSIRSADVRAACQEHGITLAQTGVRLFRH